MFGFLKSKFNHPVGLMVLFLTEASERLSFYGMRSFLVLYLVTALQYPDAYAMQISGTYMGLVYLSPLLGAYCTDRGLGQRKSILIGGLLMVGGHFALAFESLFFQGLGLIILGNGFFKPNISTMVGAQYPPGDPRIDRGYSIFYMGINIGAFFAVICGYVAQTINWHLGFSIAGFVMLLSLINFIVFQKHLGTAGFPPGRVVTADSRLTKRDWLDVLLFTAAGIALVFGILWIWPAISVVWGSYKSFEASVLNPLTALFARLLGADSWGASSASALCTLLMRAGLLVLAYKAVRFAQQKFFPAKSSDAEKVLTAADLEARKDERTQIAVIVVMTVFAAIFFTGFAQSSNSMSLFADRHTIMPNSPDLPVPDMLPEKMKEGLQWFNKQERLPSSMMQSLNPFFIVAIVMLTPLINSLLGKGLRLVGRLPFFSGIGKKMAGNPLKLSALGQQGLGLILIGFGFLVMWKADQLAAEHGQVTWLWLFVVYFIFTLGEICLSPVGLSLVNKLAPQRVASLMMSVWFLGSAAAEYIGAQLETIFEHLATTQHIEINLWLFLFAFSVIPGVILMLISPMLNRKVKGKASS